MPDPVNNQSGAHVNAPAGSTQSDKLRRRKPRGAEATPSTSSAQKSLAADGVDRASSTPMSTGDQLKSKSSGPVSTGDTFATEKTASPGAAKPAATNALQAGKNQAMSRGMKGLLTLSTLAHMGTLPFIRSWLPQVRANEPALSVGGTINRMLSGAAMGGVTTFVASAIPLGIVGAVTAAAGPAAIPLFAAILAITLYGAVCGAYHGYKSSRPPKPDPSATVGLTSTDPTSVTLTAPPSKLEVKATADKPSPGRPQLQVSALNISSDVKADKDQADPGAADTTGGADRLAAEQAKSDAKIQQTQSQNLATEAARTLHAHEHAEEQTRS